MGLNLCLGTNSELDGERSVNEVIDLLGDSTRDIHFRDVGGTVPSLRECFLGEGNYAPARVLRGCATQVSTASLSTTTSRQ